MSLDLVPEARRQVETCNACRYCEGYCSVFPAITRERAFSDGDITQLANLCHNCRGCYYACQYTEPHEFALNLPSVLAEVQAESWDRLAWPTAFAGLFQRSGVAVAVILVLAFAVLFAAAQTLRPENGKDFYAILSHTTMVAIFAPAFVLPLLAIGVSMHAYWREVGGGWIRWAHLKAAIANAAQLRNLGGGQGQGCNFEAEDRFSNARRALHQAVLYSFLLCFSSTFAGTVLHYVFDMQAPYPLLSLPKLLGLPGGLLLVIGCAGLGWFKTKADPKLGAPSVWGDEMVFLALLGAVGATGLLLYAATGTDAVPQLLELHMGCVLAFFLLTPYSKMVHGFYRMAALIRDAQIKDKP